MNKFIGLLFACVFALTACSKNCCDDAPSLRKCQENPSTNGVTCQAYFESWFYDENTGKCQKKGYSGCSEIGFTTEQECQKCDCNRLESE